MLIAALFHNPLRSRDSAAPSDSLQKPKLTEGLRKVTQMKTSHPILLDLPVLVDTLRLLLRAPQVGDGALVNAAIKESFEGLHKWVSWASKMPTLEESEIGVREEMADWILRESLRFYAFLKEGDAWVGSVAIHKHNWDLPAFEMGYWGNSSYSGQGYMTEATAAATQYAFKILKAIRVEICCDPDNERSRRIPERLNYQFEGNLRLSEPKADGSGVRDTLVFARYDLEDLPEVGFSIGENQRG